MSEPSGDTMDMEIRAGLSAVDEATGRLLATCASLTEAQARAASLLPGWTRGHVLTHLARNADGLANLLRSARTGAEIPMYASQEARDADIEAGAGRPVGELVADVRDSAARFAAEAGALGAGAWSAPVRRTPGSPAFPAREVLDRRRNELVIHHADLGAGYGPADWPADWAAEELPSVAEDFSGRDDVPACLLTAADGTFSGRIGPGGAEPVIVVEGPAWALLAWLLGRGRAGLSVRGADAPPALPGWR